MKGSAKKLLNKFDAVEKERQRQVFSSFERGFYVGPPTIFKGLQYPGIDDSQQIEKSIRTIRSSGIYP